MIVSNYSNFSISSWESYKTTRLWSLTNGDDIKTVYVKFKDSLGNESAVYSDNIIMDTSDPTGTITINNGDSTTENQTVTLSIYAEKEESVAISVYESVYGTIDNDITIMMISDYSDFRGGEWEGYSTTKTWTLPIGDGTKTVYVRFADSLGNESEIYSDSIILDTANPTGSISINNGAISTNTVNVTLNISALDANGVGQMMISNTFGFNSAAWETYAATRTWTLTTGDGTKTIYIKFKDNLGKESAVYTSTIILQTPSKQSSSPSSESQYTSAEQDELINKLPEEIVKILEIKVDGATIKAKLQPVVQGTLAKTMLTDNLIQKILFAQEQTIDETKETNDTQTQLKVIIAIPNEEKITEAQTTISVSVMYAIKSKGIEQIEISSAIATIKMPTEAIDMSNAATLSIRVKQADKEKDLTTEQKNTVGNKIVYDISATVEKNDGAKESIHNLNEEVYIKIPYELKPEEDPEMITAFLVDENGNIENKSGKYDEPTKMVIFASRHFSKYIIKQNKITFTDIQEGTPLKRQIEVMAAKGIVKGTVDSKFAPDASVTRAEFAALLVRPFNFESDSAKCNFTDIKEDKWFYREVAIAVKAGIIKGYQDGTFRPNEKISRQDMAVMLARTAKLCKGCVAPGNPNEYLDFADNADIQGYAKDLLALTVKYGIINGKSDKKFDPYSNATRAEAAKVIYELFNK